jgi:hypothetical protein
MSENENNQLVITPRTIASYFEELVVAVENGQLNPLEVFAKVKEVEKISADVKKRVEESAMQEAESHDGKTFTYRGYKFTKTEGRRMFDFSNNPEWVKLRDKIKAIEEAGKNAAKSNHLLVDEETGEVIIKPIVTYSKPSLSSSRK